MFAPPACIPINSSGLFKLFLFLDVSLDDTLLELLVLHFEQVNLVEVSVQLVEVLHVVVEACDSQLIIIVRIPHGFVPAFDLLQSPQFIFDWYLEYLL